MKALLFSFSPGSHSRDISSLVQSQLACKWPRAKHIRCAAFKQLVHKQNHSSSSLHAGLRVDFTVAEHTSDDPPSPSPKPLPGAPGLSKITLVLTEAAAAPPAFADGWTAGMDAATGAAAETLPNGNSSGTEVLHRHIGYCIRSSGPNSRDGTRTKVQSEAPAAAVVAGAQVVPFHCSS